MEIISKKHLAKTKKEKIMRILYQTLIICFAFITTLHAQLNAPNPFVGTWEHQNGTEIFRVELFITENGVDGHYSKVQTNSGSEIIIYKSNYDLGFGLENGPAIYGYNDESSLSAFIEDATNSNNGNFSMLKGRLLMEIISSNPTTATWEVEVINDLRRHDDLRELSMPTNLILTKVD